MNWNRWFLVGGAVLGVASMTGGACPTTLTDTREPCAQDGDCPAGACGADGFCTTGTSSSDGGVPSRPDAGTDPADAGSVDAGSAQADAGGGQDGGAYDDGGLAASDAGARDGGVMPADAGADAGVMDPWGDPWWNDDWSHRVGFRVVNGTATSLTGTVQMLAIAAPTFNLSTFQPDGDDLRLVSAAGDVLAYEFDSPFSSATGATVWFRLPDVPPGTSDVRVFAYFGNSAAPPASDGPSVWVDYDAVFHLSTDAPLHDSTGNLVGASLVGGDTFTSDGVVGGGAFSSTVDALSYFNVELDASDYSPSGGLHIELLARPDESVFDNSPNLYVIDRTSNNRDHFSLVLRDDSARVLAFLARDGTQDLVAFVERPRLVAAPHIFLATLVDDDEVSLQTNQSKRTVVSDAPLSLAEQRFRFGAGYQGVIDEIRIATGDVSGNVTASQSRSVRDRLFSFFPPHLLSVPPSVLAPRAGGAIALYTFDEGAGDVLVNEGTGEGLDLTLTRPGGLDVSTGVTWVGGGLHFSASTRASSDGPATSVIDACQASNEITLEAWVHPDTPYLEGPARVLSLSRDTNNRNVTLGLEDELWPQRSPRFLMRLFTTSTDENGTFDGEVARPTAEYPPPPSNAPIHLVGVFGDGNLRLYRDGVEVAASAWAGDFSTWLSDTPLVIGEEVSNGAVRPFFGTIYLAAVYCEALDASDVAQNFAAGP